MAQTLEHLQVSEDGFRLSAEEILTGRGFVTGKSGSGKSNTASVIVEELLDRNLGILLIDTDGEYHGLKEEYDLMHVGASEECDFHLKVADAEMIATYALEDQIPIILDVSTYPSEEHTEEIIYAVVEALFRAEHEYRLPFLLLVEEAHEFVPQSGGAGNSDLKSLLIRVAKRGRKRGLGICCLSQRPAAVDKDYITQCSWFVWHRLTWENDTDVVGRILGDSAEESVQSLNDGEAIVHTDWNESVERVQFRRKRTIDAGATPSLSDLDRGGQYGGSGVANESTERSASGGADDDQPSTAEAASNTAASNTTASNTTASNTTASNTADSIEAAKQAMSTNAGGGGVRFPGSTETLPVPYDQSTDPAFSPPDPGGRPSLANRREKRNPPEETVDPLWEVGGIMVYLYDTIVWIHLWVTYLLEKLLARFVYVIDRALVDRDHPRQVGRIERFTYRVVAALVVGAFYGALVLAVVLYG